MNKTALNLLRLIAFINTYASNGEDSSPILRKLYIPLYNSSPFNTSRSTGFTNVDVTGPVRPFNSPPFIDRHCLCSHRRQQTHVLSSRRGLADSTVSTACSRYGSVVHGTALRSRSSAASWIQRRSRFLDSTGERSSADTGQKMFPTFAGTFYDHVKICSTFRRSPSLKLETANRADDLRATGFSWKSRGPMIEEQIWSIREPIVDWRVPFEGTTCTRNHHLLAQ